MAVVEQRVVTRNGQRDMLVPALDRRFEAVVFDWDGTAVPDRAADASRLRVLVEELCALGLDLVVVTGTHVGNVDDQLGARPAGPGRLLLAVNRGSEVFRVDPREGPVLVYRYDATSEEDEALDAAADATVDALAHRGFHAEIVSQRLNRRKIDLIPEPAWADPPKARIAELLQAVEARLRVTGVDGLREAVDLALEAARTAGLPHARVTSDAKHVEIGLTDKADAARWAFADLWRHGIGPGLILVGGDEFGPVGRLPGSDSLLLVPESARATALSVGVEPTGVPASVLALGGGPDRFLEILDDQLARRRRNDVPDIDPDPAWSLTVEGVDPRLERVHESLLALADSRIGTRGAPLLAHPAAAPGVVMASLYEGTGPETSLAPCPEWSRLKGRLPTEPSLERTLDLRTGLLRQRGPLTSLQLSSLARPGTVAMRVEAAPARLGRGGRASARRAGALALVDQRLRRKLERLGAYGRDRSEAQAALAAAEKAGFERLLTEHREAWANRWEHADITVEGDERLQRAVRVALFHLMASVGDEGEAAVGARGLTGPGYKGHVFWDSEVFVLPFLAATHPRAARAMLEYRIRRLPAAREIARTRGLLGARFPWESADDGLDVTPASGRLATGEVVPIRTGMLEEHVTADVAWAARCYLDWTGDDEFAAGAGRDLVVETARYWASRISSDADGRAHVYGVIGPDEYHEHVDDNAFTNVMARWNLRLAAQLDGTDDEREEWLAAADTLVDGYDAETGLYEQFAGFFDLEPIVIAELAPRRPIAADLLLGAERIREAQVVKQADVLMLHHLVPDAVVSGSLVPNLDYYEPRTAHGSSLSPAIHAALFARAGRHDQALAALDLAARLDLDDLTGTTASGLHLATMGGLWQALVFGFAGLRPRGDALAVEPRLPPTWPALEVRVRFRGRPLRLRIDNNGVHAVEGDFDVRALDDRWEVVPR